MVPVEGGGGLRDGVLEELVPGFFAELVETASAEVVLVGFGFPGMVSEFEAGAEVAIGEEGRAQAGAEGEGELDTFAADGSVALDGGVVGDADGLAPALFKLFLEGETCPFGVQVGGCEGDAVFNDAGKTDGDAVEAGEERVELVEAFEDGQRRGHGGGGDAVAVADGLAGGVEEHGLEA